MLEAAHGSKGGCEKILPLEHDGSFLRAL